MKAFFRGISLTSWMLISMVLGIGLGIAVPGFAVHLDVVSNIFLRLIKSIIAPILFGLLVPAFANSSGGKAMGRVGWKSIVYFEVMTTIALLIGWGSVMLFEPGRGISLGTQAVQTVQAPSLAQVLERSFPTSIFDAMARGDVLQTVIFCFLFGAAANAIGSRAKPIVNFAEALGQVAFRYTHFVMYFAPFAVGAAMASTVASNGLGVLFGLSKLIGTAYAAQLLYAVGILGTILLLARVPMRRFYQAAREPFVVAFATTSSAAALPKAPENMEKFGIPKPILGLVMPLGLSFNLAGSTLHLAMATLFVAQAANMNLSVTQQLMILLTLKLTSKGVAGIPRANFVILSALFVSYGLPMEGLPVLLGVDAVIDMIRTGVNILGHCAAPAIISRWEGVVFPTEPTEEDATI